MSKIPALVIAPGRGVYTKSEHGYIARHHGARRDLIDTFDKTRQRLGVPSVTDLDSASHFDLKVFSQGDASSSLIFASAAADYEAIDTDKFEIVCITGNSLGWYIALACAGAMSYENAFSLVNRTSQLMQNPLLGGQLVYQIVDEHWREITGLRAELLAFCDRTPGVFVSIELGGMIVFAGDNEALRAFENALPVSRDPRFPMRLSNHAAFHTPLQEGNAEVVFNEVPVTQFSTPQTPLVDGEGTSWLPLTSETSTLKEYTLTRQITMTYNFTLAVQNAVKEYAPEKIIILGPGMTLGGAVAQALIAINWQGLKSKREFQHRQQDDHVILSMADPDQRSLIAQ